MKAAKTKVYPPPEGDGDGQLYVYVYDVFNKEFLPGKSFDTIEKATSFQRHEQERIYLEQEADPELFDLPFVSADRQLLENVASNSAYRERLVKELDSDARGRARRR
jgi:hypothetical protein